MSQNTEKEFSLETIISSAIQIPGTKVNREKFLADTFTNESICIDELIKNGPIALGLPQETIHTLASKLILKRTSQSSIASFAAGIPGGYAMAATIPADILQFFGMSLRLAQELSYLYGADDLWENGKLDNEKVKNQLILYCGVMFGVSGAVSGVRVLSAQIAKTAMRKIPQKALTKTFWYPIVKQIGKAIGIKITKTTVGNVASKVIPIVGGVVSGGLNFASMMPMAKRLHNALDSAVFDYTKEQLEDDIEILEKLSTDELPPQQENNTIKDKITEGSKKATSNLSNLFSKIKKTSKQTEPDNIEKLKQLAELRDTGVITDEEYDAKKTELLSKI